MSSKSTNAQPQSGSAWQTVLLLVAIGAILFAISRFVTTGESGGKGTEHPAVGSIAPPVEFAALTGSMPIQAAQTKGKVVLINFWGTWCPPCRTEFPRLQQATKPFLSNDDFVFASVCVPASDDEPKLDTATDADEFLKRHTALFDAVYDPDSKAFAAILVAVKSQQSVVPFTVVIDKSGKFAGVWIGYNTGDEDEVAQVIHSALDSKQSDR